jgi:hypothetical protein
MGRRLTARGSTRSGRWGLTTNEGKGASRRAVLSQRKVSTKLIHSNWER